MKLPSTTEFAITIYVFNIYWFKDIVSEDTNSGKQTHKE